jgi:hypothetical protein
MKLQDLQKAAILKHQHDDIREVMDDMAYLTAVRINNHEIFLGEMNGQARADFIEALKLRMDEIKKELEAMGVTA